MARMDTLPRVLPSLGQKALGLTREFWGTVLDRDDMREKGRADQEEADHRIEQVRRELKADVSRAKATAKETRQRSLQGREDRSGSAREEASKTGPRAGASAAAEKVKGGVKEATGSLLGNERLRKEGATQQDKASSESDVAREEAKAEEERLAAERARARGDAASRN
jgi:uncharacterized protein YjbJ (UPF0337 family)